MNKYNTEYYVEEIELNGTLGYQILDKNNELFRIVQIEPYIPYKVLNEDGTINYFQSGVNHIELELKYSNENQISEIEKYDKQISILKANIASLTKMIAENKLSIGELNNHAEAIDDEFIKLSEDINNKINDLRIDFDIKSI